MLRGFLELTNMFIILTVISTIIQVVLTHSINYLSIIPWIIYSVIYIIYKYRNREYHFPEISKLPNTELASLIAYIVGVWIIFLGLYKYPIFPMSFSGDFLIYPTKAVKLASHSELSDLYVSHPTAYTILSVCISISPYSPLITMRIFSFVIAAIIPISIFYISRSLFGEHGGVISIVTYVLISIFWFYVIFTTGIFANFIAILTCLYIIILIIEYREYPTKSNIIKIYLASLVALTLHQTTIILIASLLLVAIYDALLFRTEKLLICLLSTLLAVVSLLLFLPTDIRLIVDFITKYLLRLKMKPIPVITVVREDRLSQFLESISPFLRDLYLYVGISSIFLLIIALIIGLFGIATYDDGCKTLPWMWIIATWILSYFISDIWRLAIYTTIPLSIYIGNSYRFIYLPFKSWLESVIIPHKIQIGYKALLITIVIILILIGSNLSMVIRDFSYGVRAERLKQQTIYNSFTWISENTEKDAVLISIGKWEYEFLPLFINRKYLGDYLFTPNEVYNVLKEFNNSYVVVNRLLRTENFSYLALYVNDSRFISVYSDEYVTIFKLTS